MINQEKKCPLGLVNNCQYDTYLVLNKPYCKNSYYCHQNTVAWCLPYVYQIIDGVPSLIVLSPYQLINYTIPLYLREIILAEIETEGWIAACEIHTNIDLNDLPW